MKWTLFFLLLAVTGTLPAQQQGVDDLMAALKSGNAQQVVTHLDTYVDLKLPENPEIKNASRNQAEVILRNFFSENNIRGFEKVSEREMSNIRYITGRLLNEGKGYGATFMLRLIEGKYYIITFRIS